MCSHRTNYFGNGAVCNRYSFSFTLFVSSFDFYLFPSFSFHPLFHPFTCLLLYCTYYCFSSPPGASVFKILPPVKSEYFSFWMRKVGLIPPMRQFPYSLMALLKNILTSCCIFKQCWILREFRDKQPQNCITFFYYYYVG